MTHRFRLRSAGGDGAVRHVILDGRIVGAMVLNRYAPQPYWSWSVTAIDTVPVAGSVAGSGTAPTLEAALVAWRAAWDAIEAAPHRWMPEPPRWRPGSWRGSAP